MVTIKTLDIRFDVEGSGDEATFAQLFEKYFNRARRLEEEKKQRQRLADADRRLGDRSGAPA